MSDAFCQCGGARRALMLAACAGLLGLAEGARAGPDKAVNVVTDAVRGVAVADGERDNALLVVFVVDDAGDPLDEVTVEVLERGRAVASGRTDNRGRAVLRLASVGALSVRASEKGFVTAVARGVVLRKAALTVVALPLQQKGADE